MRFLNRFEAGKQLAEKLEHYKHQNAIVICIPRGGVMVGYPIAQTLALELDIIIPRKLPIPIDPEAGFGAITEDGTIILNEQLVKSCRLTPDKINEVATNVLAEIKRRAFDYRGERPRSSLTGRIVILVDDGLATGYTMIAAIHSIKKEAPARLIIAVPVSPAYTLKLIKPMVDEAICLITKEADSFAVASFYQDFHDISDQEVKQLLVGHQPPKLV